MATLDEVIQQHDVVAVFEIDPNDDPRIQIDNRIAAQTPKSQRCERCGGTGNEFLFMYRQCSACGGDGLKR